MPTEPRSSGNVVVTQGEMTAGRRPKWWWNTAPTASRSTQLHATGGVTITNLADAAEAREAVYTIDTGVIVLTGDVLLTQGASALWRARS
jgi:lipopolysaccharide export system protein LptA